MTTLSRPEGTPIEVWLSVSYDHPPRSYSRAVTVEVMCRVVRQDESTTEIDFVSRSMAGAQREITAYLLRQGYAPVGHWETEAIDGDHGEPTEMWRKFQVA